MAIHTQGDKQEKAKAKFRLSTCYGYCPYDLHSQFTGENLDISPHLPTSEGRKSHLVGMLCTWENEENLRE